MVVILRTLKVCEMGVAARKLEFPTWLAVMEQLPAATVVTTEPDTVQMDDVVDAKLTGRPDDAVAEIPNGATP